MFWIPFLLRVFTFLYGLGHVYGFDFVVSTPTQCGLIRFNWVGGTPPFRALIIPPGGTMKDISIPDSAWNANDQSGDFSTTLTLPKGQNVLFSMGDATGVTAGGITEAMTVGGPSAGAQNCNATIPNPDFFFSADGTLSQCKPYPFTFYSGAIQPVTILVAVPHGESFLFHAPLGDSFAWQANLTAGTSVAISMMDSQNRMGGTDTLKVVGSSDDSSCVKPLPSSAAPTRIPSPTSSASPTGGGGGGGGGDPGKKNDNTGVIIGASVGGAVGLLIIVALVYFTIKGRSKLNAFGGRKHIDLTEPGPGVSSYLLDSQQPGQYPNTFYHDAATPQAVPAGAPPAAMYNNVPNDSRSADIFAGGVAMGAAATRWAHQQSEAAANNEQRGSIVRQQQAYSQYSQQYYDPYDMGSSSSMAGASSTYIPGGGQAVRPVSDSQFGVDPGSNYRSTAGPSTASTARSGKGSISQSTSRLIVHTDIEDEPIELPPVYSESRAPIPGIDSSAGFAPRRDML